MRIILVCGLLRRSFEHMKYSKFKIAWHARIHRKPIIQSGISHKSLKKPLLVKAVSH